MGSEGGGVRGVFEAHTHGFRGSCSTQYFKPRSVRGTQKGAARRNQAHRTPRSTISTGEWPQEDSGGPNLAFFSPKPPLPPHLGGRAIFHSFSPFLVLLSPPKGKKPVPLGPQTIFGGGMYQNLHHTLLYVMVRGKVLDWTRGGQGVDKHFF